MHNILALLLSALVTALAAWLSQGLVAFTGVGDDRLALLPTSPVAFVIAGAAALAVAWAVRRGASAAPLSLLALVFLPWLPLPLPAALLMWTGPMVILVWLAVVLCMAAGAPRHPLLPIARGPRTAAVLAFVLGALAFWQVSPSLPAGDEPHYLVITQSLLKDADLRIENNHRQRDYRAYFAGDINPDFRVRGRDREIYSIHAPGVPALVAPAFAIGGYYGAVLLLLALAAAGSALAWHLAWLTTGRHDAAWFGWAAVTLSATWVFHSFAVFPDGPGAVVVLTGVWALLRAEREIETRAERALPWLLHGAALAALPWMHTRFAALAGTLGALVLLRLGRTPNALGKAGAFLAIPTISAIAWIGFFIAIYGTPDPSAPYGGEPGALAFVPDGLAGLFFDQSFGALAYAPVLMAALAGVVVMLRRGPASRRQALELLFVAVPYLVVVTYVAMWWGGTSAPARFLVPLVPWLALPAAAAWTAMNRPGRVAALAALAFTAFATAVLVSVDDGRLAFNIKEEPARWLTWLNGGVDLGRGLPLWFREQETPLFRGIAVWLLCGGAALLALRALASVRVLASRARYSTAAAFAFAIAGSAALSITWAAEGVAGRAPAAAQLDVLRRLSSEPRLLALQVSPPARLTPAAVPQRIRIEPAFSTISGGAGRNDRPLFAVPAIPAGEYRLRFARRENRGWLMVGIGRDQFALRTEPLETMAGSVDLDFPVDVRAIMVRGDEDARRAVSGLTIEPLRIVPAGARLTTGYARRAVRYPTGIVYFLDDRSFPEPEGFWVGGERDSSVVLQPDAAPGAITLLVRNGAAANSVRVESGRWAQDVTLAPGEEKEVQVPIDPARRASLVRIVTSAGFRPSAVDAKSRDERFLGVWVKLR